MGEEAEAEEEEEEEEEDIEEADTLAEVVKVGDFRVMLEEPPISARMLSIRQIYA